VNTQILTWSLAAVLTAVPTWYFLRHWHDQSFRDGAIGNWFGTVIGVIVGVPVAIYLVRVQQRAQERAEAEQRRHDRAEQVRNIRERLFEEVQYNLSAVGQLEEILKQTVAARSDLWDWARQVVDTFEFAARREFEAISLTDSERAAYAMLDLAYRDLRRLGNNFRQAGSAYAFLLGYSANEGVANWQLGETRQFAGIVVSHLRHAADNLDQQSTQPANHRLDQTVGARLDCVRFPAGPATSADASHSTTEVKHVTDDGDHKANVSGWGREIVTVYETFLLRDLLGYVFPVLWCFSAWGVSFSTSP
jgi:hypothetical protein